jgi:uncharacterized membrane protein (UPF0127 family)
MSKPTFLGPLIGKGAGQCELVYAERGSLLASHVEPALDSKTRKRGLLGRESIPDDYAMIIAPCSAIHTFSMRVPIDVVFVSRNGTITKTCRGVRPWRAAGSMRAFAVIEAAEGFIDRHELVPGEVVAVREIAGGPKAAEASPIIEPKQAAEPAMALVEPIAVPRRHTTSHKRVTLADVIAAKTPLAWFEAVAIVQELCEAVLARGPADDLRVPELKHIVLTAEGGVTLAGDGPSGHSPVQRTGLVLLALTPEEQLPMQLRLLVLEEVSPRPKLKSLGDLHRELEFFERPDRQSIVRDVYDRFQRLSTAAAVEPAVPPPLLEPPPPRRHHDWWKRRSVWTGSLIILTTLAAAAVIWAWPRPEGLWLRKHAQQFSQVSLDTGRKAAEAVRHEVSSARWKLGFRPREPERSVLVLAEPGPPRATELGQSITLEGRAAAPPVPPLELPRIPLEGGLATARAVPAPGPSQVAAESRMESVFSALDGQVVPPKLVSPTAVPSAPEAAGPQPLPEVELVVSPAGEVESVKLVSGRTSALSGMQLSAIKAWRFEPATRDGQPVRYRLRVRVPAQ